MKRRHIFILLALLVPFFAMAQKPDSFNLWPKGAPNDNGDVQDTAKVWVYLPNKKAATGRAVVICPGGGYEHLAIDKEGHNWASFFNQEGVAVIVLKYRMPHGKHKIPISDAEEAIKMVRRNAIQWNINPNDIGIMGFSAGGHLASTIATHSEKNAKPNFQILFYPVITMMPDITHKGSRNNFLGEEPKKKDELPEENSLSFPSTMTGEAHLCKKCGSVLNVVQSKKPERHGQWYRICPKYSSDDKGHTFEWVE